MWRGKIDYSSYLSNDDITVIRNGNKAIQILPWRHGSHSMIPYDCTESSNGILELTNNSSYYKEWWGGTSSGKLGRCKNTNNQIVDIKYNLHRINCIPNTKVGWQFLGPGGGTSMIPQCKDLNENNCKNSRQPWKTQSNSFLKNQRICEWNPNPTEDITLLSECDGDCSNIGNGCETGLICKKYNIGNPIPGCVEGSAANQKFQDGLSYCQNDVKATKDTTAKNQIKQELSQAEKDVIASANIIRTGFTNMGRNLFGFKNKIVEGMSNNLLTDTEINTS